MSNLIQMVSIIKKILYILYKNNKTVSQQKNKILLYEFIYTMRFKGMSLWKESHLVGLPLHQFNFQVIMHSFTMFITIIARQRRI